MNNSLKILYVEDDKGAVEGTKRPLEHLSDELFIAYDGEEGLQKYIQHRPDIVISDIRMPKKDGLEMCREIKKIDPKQHILLLSAYSDANYFLDAINMQVDGYILKPIDFNILETKINFIIGQIELERNFKLQQEKIKEQEIHIVTQMKNAQMGDIIKNIAHQWRQPLNIISASIGHMQLKKELDSLNDTDIDSTIDTITRTTQTLSKTIDSFKEYIQEQNYRKTVILQKRIATAINITQASLMNENIRLIDNTQGFEPIEITLMVGELTQVVINLINNAKDALKGREDAHIEVCLEKDKNSAVIKVIDNGCGVPFDIVDKVFDPYFTTNFKSTEKGLGLYTSKNIVEKSLKGSLCLVNNIGGATFEIRIPIDSEIVAKSVPV